jgi:16S rRNA G1207 methylase RsmC
MKTSVAGPKRDIVFETALRGRQFTFHSTWGLFSPTEIDAGTRLLIEEMDIAQRDTVLDVGCGYGAIGIVAASIANRGITHMVDKDFVAVEHAKRNAETNGVKNTKTYLSNLLSNVPQMQFDVILSNPPAQGGRELLSIFLHDAKLHLKTGGKIYLVTVSGLKEFVKRNFKKIFGNYTKIRQSGTHTVALARNE